MKILEVTPDFPPVVRGGGAQTFYLLANSWVRLGHQVTVVTSCPINKIRMFQGVGNVFDLHPFPLINPIKRYENLEYYMPMGFSSMRSYRKYLKANMKDFDLIVVHGFLETLPLISLLTLDRVALSKVVLTNHGLSTAEYSPKIHLISRMAHKYLARIVLSRVSNVVMYSKSAMSEFIEFYPNKSTDSLRLHSLGIDADDFRNSFNVYMENNQQLMSKLAPAKAKPFFLAVGRNAKIKGFDIVIRALSLISMDNYHPVLLIAGDRTPYTEQLEILANNLGLCSQVRFLGRINEVEKLSLMAECQALVIPSLKEGYGINAMEGRILGIPVIATRTGAHGEILSEYPHGTIIPPNDVNALAAAMRKYTESLYRDRFYLNEEYLSSVDIKGLAEFYLEFAK